MRQNLEKIRADSQKIFQILRAFSSFCTNPVVSLSVVTIPRLSAPWIGSRSRPPGPPGGTSRADLIFKFRLALRAAHRGTEQIEEVFRIALDAKRSLPARRASEVPPGSRDLHLVRQS